MKNLTHIEDRLEALPKRRAMKIAETGKAKEIRDYRGHWNNPFPYDRMAPYLRAQVGRRWDSVIHDFVHVDWVHPEHRTHHKLAEFVETHTFLENGEVYYFSQTWHSDAKFRLKDDYKEVFYVDPKTRRVARKPRTKQPEYKRPPKDYIILRPYDQLHKDKNGIWYRYYVKPQDIEKAKLIKKPDAPFNKYETASLSEYVGLRFISVNLVKQQLNTDQLRKYDLNNDQYPQHSESCPVCGGRDCYRHKSIYTR